MRVGNPPGDMRTAPATTASLRLRTRTCQFTGTLATAQLILSVMPADIGIVLPAFALASFLFDNHFCHVQSVFQSGEMVRADRKARATDQSTLPDQR